MGTGMPVIPDPTGELEFGFNFELVGPGACRAAASALNGSGQQPENEPVPSSMAVITPGT